MIMKKRGPTHHVKFQDSTISKYFSKLVVVNYMIAFMTFFLLLLKSQRTISLYIHRVFLATFSIWCITGTAVVVILLKRVWL